MTGFIKLQIGFLDKPEVAIVAKKLRVSHAEAAVSMLRVIIWAAQNSKNGAIQLLSLEDIDRLAKAVAGTCDCLASSDVNWIQTDGLTTSFNNWEKHNGEETITVKASKAKPRTRESVIFVPPTVQEVEEYCREKGHEIDAISFVDFYQSKGWMVGQNKMRDWHAAIRTWAKRNSSTSRPTQQRQDPRGNMQAVANYVAKFGEPDDLPF